MSKDEDSFYGALRYELRKLDEDKEIRLRRQVGIRHKDQRYRMDFLLSAKHRAICVEHDGQYHYGRLQSLKDSERDERIIAALHYHFIQGSRVARVFEINREEFLDDELPKLVNWLKYGNESGPGFDWSRDREAAKKKATKQ